MNKRDAAKLRKERLAQIDRAVTARLWAGESQASVFRERDRQIRLSQEEYERNIATPSPRQQSKRELSTSRFWRHFDENDRPIPPWLIEVGTGETDYDDDDDQDVFADGDYSYDDFDADWGGYEYSDTGYPDEDA